MTVNYEEQKLNVCELPLNCSAMIGASAGTGKTYTITYLVLRLLLNSGEANKNGFGRPLTIDELLIVTFTDAAASDLRERVRQKIREARVVFELLSLGANCPEDKQVLQDSLEEQLCTLVFEMTGASSIKDFFNEADPQSNEINLKALKCARTLLAAERSIDDASICTIHSFCNQALNQIYSFEAAEAFDEELCSAESLSEIVKQADHETWRKLFYHQDDKTRALFDLVGILNPEDDELQMLIKYLVEVQVSDNQKNVPVVHGYAVSGAGIERFKGKKNAVGIIKELLTLASEVEGNTKAIDKDFQEFIASNQGIIGNCNDFSDFISENGCGLISLSSRLGAKVAYKSFFDLSCRMVNGEALSITEFVNALNEKCKQEKFSEDWLSYYTSKVKKAVEDGQYPEFSKFYNFLSSLDQWGKRYLALSRNSRIAALTAIAMLMIDHRAELVKKAGKLSFDELLRKLDFALHRDDEHSGDKFASILRNRFPVAIIDEFQDTDPVQFSIFKKLYLEKKEEKSNSLCFLIGDPKQSIYRFRGADVNSYLRAGAIIREQNNSQNYTLNENFRSSYGVVHGVNMIFRGFGEDHVNADPFFDHNTGEQAGTDHNNVIECPEVIPHLNPDTDPPLYGKLRFLMKDDNGQEILSTGNLVCFEPLPENLNKKSSLAPFQSTAAAQLISEILTYGYLEDKHGKQRRVKNADIAILVRSGTQFKAIKRALNKLEIPCVYYSDNQSVLHKIKDSSNDADQRSECAYWMISFMEACCNFSSRSKILTLLSTPMLALSKEEFSRFSDGDELSAEAELLRECAQKWQQSGFVAGFELWSHKHYLLKRLLQNKRERDVTDIQQIAELIQGKHQELQGIYAQLRWFKRIVSDVKGEFDEKALKRRLESEQEQVKVFTIHKSKGLEFPVTVLPFLYSPKAEASFTNSFEPVVAYDERLSRKILFLNDDSGRLKELNKVEEHKESARLLYVALTRACAVNVLFFNNSDLTDQGSALMRELNQSLGSSAEVLKNTLKNCDPRVFTLSDRKERKPYELINMRNAHLEITKNTAELFLSTLKRGDIPDNFTVSSYSALTRGLHDQVLTLPEQTLESNEEENAQKEQEVLTASAPASRELCAATFPRGTDAGTFLHEFLENFDFAAFHDLENSANDKNEGCSYIATAIKSKLKHDDMGTILCSKWYQMSGYQVAELSDENHIDAFVKWFSDIVHCPLDMVAKGFSLSKLTACSWIPEMEYLVPSSDVTASKINELCKLSASAFESVIGKDGIKALKLSEKKVNGFVTGSLDLVFKAEASGSQKFFVADYKSTYLGDRDDDYTEEQIITSVFSPRCRYDVQYLIYSLALFRFLRSRIKDDSVQSDEQFYDKYFGGVLYLYLRGMKAKGGAGVFYTKPSFEIIDALNRLFSGHS